MKRSRTIAFTLIELLVVIGIIAILAAIAFPVFSTIMEKAHATQDASNLRQIGAGTVAYLTDNNNAIFSEATTAVGPNNSTLYAPGLLQNNYLPGAQVFHSPFDIRPNALNPAIVSYGVNTNILDQTTVKGSFNGNFKTLVSASQLILYAPFYTGKPTTTAAWTYLANTQNAQLPTGGTGMAQGTHDGGQLINVLYCDFHVATVKFSDFQTTVGQTASNGISALLQWYPLGEASGE